MAISRDQVDEIKSRVSIIDVAAERVNLSRHGSTMSCCCPFHQEKTPSCVLYEKTNSFYCFGCGTSGDVISFIRGTDNLSYVEAVQQLAQRAGITIDAKGAQLNQREQELRDRIRACNREAARYFFRSLTQDDEGSVGRTYLLNERGLSMAAVRHFGLGYAKPESFGLVNYLRDKGFTDDEMITANLAYQSKTGHVMDRFRDRIMYPIFDTVGNVIAFGGRALNKEDKAKYINTNTTPVFRKSNNLYGYNFARKAHSDHLILAEGYMDVIALQTAGFAGAVASLGTSLTEEQAMLEVPTSVIQKKLLELGAMRIDVRNGTEIWQPTYRGKLVGRTDLSILDQYNGEVRGFCNYYAIANNRSKLHKFRYIMEYSFYKTLACKYRTTKGKIIAQYRIVKDIGVKFQDKHGNERIRLLWKDSLARDPYPLGKEADIIHKPKGILKKPSLGARLKANRCEWCGKETSALVMHQVRTLKELDESQPWAVFMKRINRKTLVVCESCHTKIHGAGCE